MFMLFSLSIAHGWRVGGGGVLGWEAVALNAKHVQHKEDVLLKIKTITKSSCRGYGLCSAETFID